jgi:aminoglycoside phosphotransferase (APT) family kinase protein
MEELRRRLAAALPRSGPAAVVHGDYRFDNTVLDWDDAGRIVAVLDWEMATLGDPLADVGLLLTWWGEPGEAGLHLPPAATVTAQPGFFTRAEVAEAYARASGRDLGSLDFYVVLAHYKLAIIAEGIFARFLQGKTVGEGFEGFGAAIPVLAESALDLAGRSSIPALAGRR